MSQSGSVRKTHQVVLGEHGTGVLAVGDADAPDNQRRPVLDTALGLDVETIEPEDAVRSLRSPRRRGGR